MLPRFLFGPVTTAWAEDHLPNACQTGRCIPFGPGDSWNSIKEQLPAGWQPDFLALHLAYRHVSPTLWTAPLPLVALGEDWNLLWHYYRRVLPVCELVLTDMSGVEALRRAGILHARCANLFGLPQSFLTAAPPTKNERDIDVLFVGNLHPAVQRERLSWLGRLARLKANRNVCIRTNVFGADYKALLARARIVFNRSIRGECNRRAFEATAAGAVLFQEDGNQEVARYFRDWEECIFYRDDNLEALLDHYLTHEEERRAIAEAGQRRAQAYSFEMLWDEAVGDWEALLPEVESRRQQRRQWNPVELLLTRTDQAQSCSHGRDEALSADVTQALAAQPHDAPCSMRGESPWQAQDGMVPL